MRAGRQENLKTVALKTGELAGVLKSVVPALRVGMRNKDPELKPGPRSKPRSTQAT